MGRIVAQAVVNLIGDYIQIVLFCNSDYFFEGLARRDRSGRVGWIANEQRFGFRRDLGSYFFRLDTEFGFSGSGYAYGYAAGK